VNSLEAAEKGLDGIELWEVGAAGRGEEPGSGAGRGGFIGQGDEGMKLKKQRC
jgi:hypothetical protein